MQMRLPYPPQCPDFLPFNTADRRRGRAQQKRAHNTDLFQDLPENAFLQRFNVDNDVGKLRHGFQNTAGFEGGRGDESLCCDHGQLCSLVELSHQPLGPKVIQFRLVRLVKRDPVEQACVALAQFNADIVVSAADRKRV